MAHSLETRGDFQYADSADFRFRCEVLRDEKDSHPLLPRDSGVAVAGMLQAREAHEIDDFLSLAFGQQQPLYFLIVRANRNYLRLFDGIGERSAHVTHDVRHRQVQELLVSPSQILRLDGAVENGEVDSLPKKMFG